MLLKITPVIKTGQVGASQAVETESMDVELKQASHYLKGSDVFKFFVISKVKSDEK